MVVTGRNKRLRTVVVAGAWFVTVCILAVCGERVSLAQSSDPVVIVPFANLSRQVSDTWIGTGIAQTIVAELRERDVALRAVTPLSLIHI